MSDDFLNVDTPPAQKPLTKEEQLAREIEFAKLYVETFVLNPSGKKLLQHWDKTLLRRRLPVNATLNEYVSTEARRAFVQEILNNIELAQSRDF